MKYKVITTSLVLFRKKLEKALNEGYVIWKEVITDDWVMYILKKED